MFLRRMSRRPNSTSLILLATTSCWWLFSSISPAMGQSQSDIDRAVEKADDINREREQKLREQRRRERLNAPKTRNLIEPDKRDENISNEKCWNINKLELIGVTVFNEADKNQIKEKYEGQCLRLGEINAILNDITTLYFDAGYITSRAYIEPKQDLNTGILKIRILEGILEKIILKDNKDGKSIALNMIFTGQEGRIFQLRDIEQGLDQINRLGSNDASFTIEPGTQAGGSILVITNISKSPIAYTLSRSTTGSKSTGQDQLSITVSIDNPLELSDNLSFSATRTWPPESKKYSKSVSTNYSVPYGHYTGTASLSFSEFSSPIPLSSGGISSSNGTSVSAGLGIEKMLYRNQISTLSGNVGLGVKNSDNYFDQNRIKVSSNQQANISAGLNFDTLIWDGLLYGSYTQTRGLNLLGIGGDEKGHQETNPSNEYTKHETSLGYMKSFNIGPLGALSASSNLSAQYSADVLYSGDQISVGGYYSVRGFPNVSIGGSQGFYVQNELSKSFQIPLNYLKTQLSASPYLGYDYGKIFEHKGGDQGHLSSFAYGLRLSNSILSFDIMHAHPLSYPSSIDKPVPEVQMIMSLTKRGLFDDWEDNKGNSERPFWLQSKSLGFDWFGGGWFAGLEKSTIKYELTKNFSAGANYIDHDSQSAWGIVLGRKIGNADIYAKAHIFDEKETIRMNLASLNADFKLIDSPFSPFIGISGGYYRYKEENLDSKNPLVVIRDQNNNFTNKIDIKGPTIGGKIGLIYDGPGVDIYGYYEQARAFGGEPISFDGVSAELQLRKIRTVGLGLKVKF